MVVTFCFYQIEILSTHLLRHVECFKCVHIILVSVQKLQHECSRLTLLSI